MTARILNTHTLQFIKSLFLLEKFSIFSHSDLIVYTNLTIERDCTNENIRNTQTNSMEIFRNFTNVKQNLITTVNFFLSLYLSISQFINFSQCVMHNIVYCS